MAIKIQPCNEQKPAQQTDHGKRELIQKSLLGTSIAVSTGAVYPSRWLRPILDSIILPAHAQTSLCVGVFTGNVSGFCGVKTIEITVVSPAVSVKLVFPEQESLLGLLPEITFNGNGNIEVDDSFDIVVMNEEEDPLTDVRVLGNIALSCSQITGIVEDADKTNGVGFCFDTGTFTAAKQ